MEWLQGLWNEYGTVIMTFIGSGFGAVVMGFVSNFTAKLAANKITGTFDVNRIVSEVTEKVTQNVVKSITGSVLDVDISALVEQKLDETLGEITVKIEDVKNSVDSMKECSALTAKAVGKSKLLEREEQEALTNEAEKLSQTITQKEKPRAQIKLSAKNTSTNDTRKKNLSVLSI